MRGLSPVVASGAHSSLRCAGLSLSRPLLWQSTGSRRAGSVVVAHGPSCSAACGIFPDQGSNPCPVHWQADSQPLHHQGSPKLKTFCTAKENINKMKRQPMVWEKIFAKNMIDQGLTSKICKQLIQVHTEKNKQLNQTMGRRPE